MEFLLSRLTDAGMMRRINVFAIVIVRLNDTTLQWKQERWKRRYSIEKMLLQNTYIMDYGYGRNEGVPSGLCLSLRFTVLQSKQEAVSRIPLRRSKGNSDDTDNSRCRVSKGDREDRQNHMQTISSIRLFVLGWW